jgi:two-component system OmpR family response regulator
MKILIVEDDYRLARSMYQALHAQHIVELALSGEEALEAVAADNFELVILDLYLPDMQGIMICKKLRKMGHQMPILIVTGEQKPTTIVELLDAGADDYLKKPFVVAELKARIRALGRRYQGITPPPRTITLGDLTLHCGSHIAERQGQEIYLRNKEFIILEQLMLNPDIVISRATLLDKAWDDAEKAWTNLIDVHIKYLRDKIDKPFGTHSIQTIHGLGYKFVPSSGSDDTTE